MSPHFLLLHTYFNNSFIKCLLQIHRIDLRTHAHSSFVSYLLCFVPVNECDTFSCVHLSYRCVLDLILFKFKVRNKISAVELIELQHIYSRTPLARRSLLVNYLFLCYHKKKSSLLSPTALFYKRSYISYFRLTLVF